MEHRAIAIWLKKKAAYDAALSLVSGMFILVGGLVVIVITFFCAYAVVWFIGKNGLSPWTQEISTDRMVVPRGVNLALAGGIVALLFIGNGWLRRAYRRDRETKQRTLGRADRPAALVHLHAFPGASSRKKADILFCGPRLVEIAFDQLKKADRLRRLDVETCARVLAVLAARDARIPLSELRQAAGVRESAEDFLDLRDITGVVFLTSDPPGLSLTSDLRDEIFRELGIEPGPAFATGEHSEKSRAHSGRVAELLRLSRTASIAEFEAACERWLEESRTSDGAGPAEVTQREVEAVKAAYAAFLSKHKGKAVEEVRQEVDRVWEQFKRPLQ